MFLSRPFQIPLTITNDHHHRPALVMNRTIEEEDDPLSLYEQSIAAAATTTTNKSLQTLLEQVINKFKSDVRYKNSPRYLRLCFIYIFYLNNNPSATTILPILQNMIDNQIGDKLSSLYEAIAFYQLQQNRILDAEATLLLGISKKAEPIKRLKHVLETLYIEERVDFDIHQYNNLHQKALPQTAFKQSKKPDIHIRPDSNETVVLSPSSYTLVKSQLLSFDHRLEQSIQSNLSRHSLIQRVPIEVLNQQQETIHYDEDFLLLKKDMEETLRLVKRRKTITKKNGKKDIKPAYEEPTPALSLKPLPPKQSFAALKASQPSSKPTEVKFLPSRPQKRKKGAAKKSDNIHITPAVSPPALETLSISPPKQTSNSQLKKDPKPRQRRIFRPKPNQEVQLQKPEIIKGPEAILKEPTKFIKSKHTIPTITQEEITNVVQLPHHPRFVEKQLSAHGVLERDNYHVIHQDAQPTIQKRLKTWFFNSDSNNKKSSSNQQHSIQLLDKEFHVLKKLGEGGMAAVYLVQNKENLSFYGLKVQQPPFPWEFYILDQLYQRKKKKQQYLHLLPVFDFYHYKDTSFLLMAHLTHGTLLNALNLYRQHWKQPHMPEEIVLLFVMELMKEIYALHQLFIAHNDLKLDNVMLSINTSEKKKEVALPTVFLIDFGRSIDLLALPTPTSKVKANWPPGYPQTDYPLLNKEYDPKHADYWQLATMAHLLLFGVPMRYFSMTDKKTKSDNSGDAGKYQIHQGIKRYWHKNEWVRFFDIMLNPPADKMNKAVQSLIQDFQKSSHDVSKASIATFLHLFDDHTR